MCFNKARRPSGLRKTIDRFNSLAHRTTWLRSDLDWYGMVHGLAEVGGQAVLGRQLIDSTPWVTERDGEGAMVRERGGECGTGGERGGE